MMTRFWMAGGNALSRLLPALHLRMCSSTGGVGSRKESPVGSAYDVEQKFEQRESRRRYSAANTSGRSKYIRDIIASLKSQPKAEMAAIFDKLHPRDKLDILRMLGRRSARRAAGLPTYRSHIFERRYFFREEDLCEQSTLGRGPGGQATNRRMQTAIVKHKPTGIVVKFSKFPSYWLNRRAAREILNFRLEEHLLGPRSRIVRSKQREEARRLRHVQARERMVERGRISSAKMSQQRGFHAVLTNVQPFPFAVLLQLGPGYMDHTLFISDLFEGECNRWWPLLATAFAHLNKGVSQNGSDINEDSTEMENLKVPELFRYLFPVVPFSSLPPTSVEKYEWSEVEKCAADEVALQNVLRALRCFVELFGLHLLEGPLHDGGGHSTLVLIKDGLNWVEFKGRMVASNDRMTPLALTCFSHVVLSLTQLRRAGEANAIVAFFLHEAKAGVRCQWAAHGWNKMRHVRRRYELLQQQKSGQAGVC
ncbi:putative peptide chain release factor 1 [Trypanosoma rangeli]|uniref:Putative peptide chain release factor 1 n=1 Tax=Trypanosoma rangeli TaxID=5698 RepID=A0A3R7MQL4_TRYRA|nr:putative peptide chain release factor 1 [Trypanosoma rangeli]RNF06641.1 putative peptide chain release factor 1 [Trypanosoma rangeli]|eukprot:RNF06641.1 putative peptide chain release factor 1 [Trypanosoma rangeli]